MNKICFISFIALFAAFGDARRVVTRMTPGRSCSCRHRIQTERDDAISKHNSVLDEIDKMRGLITITTCEPGYSFVQDIYNSTEIICDKCELNYYRTKTNTTCLHCPEGFKSNEARTYCIRDNSDDIHMLCPIGSVVGSNPYATYLKSCITCDEKKREYAGKANNKDMCDICPRGSVISNNKCSKCPIGYYEKDNECVECDVGYYNNITGASKCIACNNNRAYAYTSVGGISCEDNILYDYIEKIKNYVSVPDTISDSIVNSMQISSSVVYNNRRLIGNLASIGGIIGFTIAIMSSS